MLKNLLSEFGNSLRRSNAASAAADPLEGWRAEFRGAHAARRQTLMAELDGWIAAHPQRKQGWTLRGEWRTRNGDLADAEQDFREALRIDPLSPAAQEGLGLVLLHVRRLDDAYLHLETAHKLKPMDADILNHWGLVALELGNLADARSKFERAVERDARNPHSWHNLGLIATKLGRPMKGIEYLRRAIELKPDHGLAYSNVALAHRDAEQLDQAVVAAKRAVELKNESSRVWVVLGDVLIDSGAFEESERALQHASALNRSDHTVQVALGKLYSSWGRHADAERAYREALSLAPRHPEAEGGLGQLDLLLERFEVGWDRYEARRRSDTAPVRSFPFVEWDGSDLQGLTLLVHAEQGLGDLILFASCLPEVIDRAGHVVIETYPRLARLFQRSFPRATIVGRDVSEPGLDWLQPLPSIDRHVAAGTLPRLLRRDTASFPLHRGYLRTDPERVEHFRQRLAALGPAPVVGLTWRGGLARSAGAQRSMELAELLRALAPLGAHLVSLQYGEVGAEIDAAVRVAGVPLHHWPESLIDQDDAAGLTMALDAVVTVCQTQAHLTGALGQRGCVLVPANPNWRYGAVLSTMRWYPSLHLARQSRFGQWSDALADMSAWLEKTLSSSVGAAQGHSANSRPRQWGPWSRSPAPAAASAGGEAADAVKRAEKAGEAVDSERDREVIDRPPDLLPGHPSALIESAQLNRSSGRLDEALRQLDEALLTAPEPAVVHLEIGKTHIAARDLPAAIDALSQATNLDVKLGEAWSQLGYALSRMEQYQEAADALRIAVDTAPPTTLATVWFHYGQVLHMLRRIPEALDAYRHSLALDPSHLPTLMAAGNAEMLLERDEAALVFYERAAELEGTAPMGLQLHLAMAYQYVGRWRDAQRTYEQLLATSPNDNLARWYLSQCDLALCNWERGWAAYGTRFAAGASPYRPLPFKPWRGEPAPDDTLLILADQGLGDEIMFASCIPDAMARVKHCIVECEPRLEKMFRRSFPGAAIVASARDPDGKWLQGIQQPQWQIFGGDLCGLFRRNEADFKPHAGYLKADPARVEYWRQRLTEELGPGPKVGVSWRGGSDKTRTRSRSMEAQDWEPILSIRGCHFVNLQYGNYLPELATINERFGPVVCDYPEALADYDETAALVTALDLVTTVCTAIVHLGGSLGRPVWVLVPFSPGWRYTVERERMPWYPSTRLFRQPAIGDWSSPCRALSEELARLTQNVGAAHA